MDPVALVAWLPPAGMTGVLHAFDARVGGGYEMSLFYPPAERHFHGKTAEREDRVAVRFVELTPPHRIVQAVRFVSDDRAYSGEMTLTMTIEPVAAGTGLRPPAAGAAPGGQRRGRPREPRATRPSLRVTGRPRLRVD